MSTPVAVRVHPGARREGVIGRLANGEWKLAVRARAEDGRANEAVLDLLAEVLDIGRRCVTLAGGGSSRSKRIAVEGLELPEVERRLAARAGTHGE